MGTPTTNNHSTAETTSMSVPYGASAASQATPSLTASSGESRTAHTYSVSSLDSRGVGESEALSSASFHHDNAASQLSPLSEFPSCRLTFEWEREINQVKKPGEPAIIEKQDSKYICLYFQQKQNQQTHIFRMAVKLIGINQQKGNYIKRILSNVTFPDCTADLSRFDINCKQLSAQQKAEIEQVISQSGKVFIFEKQRERVYGAKLITTSEDCISLKLSKEKFQFCCIDSEKSTDGLVDISKFVNRLPQVTSSDQNACLGRDFLKRIMNQITPVIKSSVAEGLAKRKNDNQIIARVESDIIKLERDNQAITQGSGQVRLKINMFSAATHNGEFVFVIDNVVNRINRAENNEVLCVHSPDFYTSHSGFRMRLHFYFKGDGDGRGTHASVYLVLLPGDYDAVQKWPFTQKITFYWLNQNHPNDEQAHHIEKSIMPKGNEAYLARPADDRHNNGAGISQFAPIDTFYDEAFVKDDTMFIKAKVDLRGLE